jgi:hypothetical protein
LITKVQDGRFDESEDTVGEILNILPQRRHFEERQDTVGEIGEMNLLPQPCKFMLAQANFVSGSKETSTLDTSSNGQKMVKSQSLPAMHESTSTLSKSLKMTQTQQSQPDSQLSTPMRGEYILYEENTSFTSTSQPCTPTRGQELFKHKLFGGFKRSQTAMAPAQDTGPEYRQQGQQQRLSPRERLGQLQVCMYVCIYVCIHMCWSS